MNIEQINDSFYKIGIPVPFPMKFVYCYLFVDGDDSTLIDVGINYEEGQRAWIEVFQKLSIKPTQISRIFLTHFHPDHSGLAGWMQEQTGAPVFLTEADQQMFLRNWGEGSTQHERLGKLLQENGMPEELKNQVVYHMKNFVRYVTPLPKLEVLDQQEIIMGGSNWKVIPTPGHSDGHICLYNETDKTIIVADHVLHKTTPNVSYWPGGHEDPLGNYLDSLEKIRMVDAVKVLSSHGKEVSDLDVRAKEIIMHHHERLEKMRAVTRGGATAYEVALETFQADKLTPHQWRFAMAETLSHLFYLEKRKRIQVKQEEGIFYYYQ